MKPPEVHVERDAPMRGWEITVTRDDDHAAAVLFMSDQGSLHVTAFKEGVGYTVHPEDTPLELGRTYSYDQKAAAA